jgi:glycerophosphoryl diester phosphodiesterase
VSPEPASNPDHDFYSIAHRAGNNLHALEVALEEGVDAIECDFWHNRGRLSLRHERKLPALPVLYDKWYLRLRWGELTLRDLLKEINFRAELFLDIKSGTPRAAEVVLDLYRDHESMLPPTRVSSKQWKLLDLLGAAGTDMHMYYSVGQEWWYPALLRRAEREHPPAGTSIQHRLLTPQRVEELHRYGLQVYAWTVNTPHRAKELLGWGVDGLISDDPKVFRLDETLYVRH